ncbi:MAG: archaemetzincin family Zn-dependent metalloprotease [Euryarchaeota archaeon]|nr:archaemetzincin family Zn-dependent metalloprotease [Euryarchaeota archaeon]
MRLVERLGRALERQLGVECRILERRELPPSGRNPLRGQYSGEVLLGEVARLRAERGAKHLGIVDVDLYAGGLNFIFGIAQVGGDFALISLYRLRQGTGEEGLFRRALKEAIHELGHTLGMVHCPERRCVMSFSNSLDEVDAKSAEFCGRHRAQLSRVLGAV